MDGRHVLPQIFRERAESDPDRIFIQEVGGPSLTYCDLQTEIDRWACAYRARGVVEHDVVSVMLPNGSSMLLAWMGVASLKALELPINTSFKGKMLSDVMVAAGSKLAVVHAQYLDRVLEIRSSLIDLETIVVVGDHDDLEIEGLEVVMVEEFLTGGDGVELPDVAFEPHDSACIVWTSGTTGPSKGTLVSWTQLLWMGTGAFPPEDMGPGDAVYSPFPLFYVGGKLFLYLCAYVDARLVVRERFNTTTFWEEIREYGCTYSPLNPAMTYFLHKQPRQPDDAQTPLHSILLAPIIPEIDDFCERFGVRVRTVYNSTELSCPIVSEWNPKNTKSCGRIRPGYQVRVVDEHDYEVPPGEVGELVVRSDEPWRLMKEYFKRPDATVETWRNLWFHTGDAFSYDEEGNYYFIDRLKDAIRRRGQNISSAEVEEAVNEHPAVAESAAVAAPSEWGEDEVRVVVTLREGHELTPVELFEFVKERLPRFMVPRFIDLVEELPKTPTEKIQKSELRRQGVTNRTWDREKVGLKV